MSSEKGSKFGMLKNLTQPIPEALAEKQESRKTEKQKNVEPPPLELKHYSTYMPAELYAQLQVYVARQKSVKSKRQDKASIQNVITEAVKIYLDKHDK